ncbi:MAG: hypothetical protein NZ739_12030, partial [Verrucomicrobiae bacterium]|nr:hypothetical protein [Verrucomicrobiae bacterium]
MAKVTFKLGVRSVVADDIAMGNWLKVIAGLGPGRIRAVRLPKLHDGTSRRRFSLKYCRQAAFAPATWDVASP